jgi:hypothetical protein
MNSSRTPVRATRTRITAVLATVIRIVGWLAVLVLVAHIVLSLGDANPANSITRFVSYWAGRLELGFQDLFAPPDARMRVVLNYGLAALVWLVASSVLASLVRRAG